MITYGILGCGHIAKKHVAAIKATENTKLVAVCDTDEKRMTEFTIKGIKGYTYLSDFLKKNMDVVCICTPSGLHSSLTIQVANAKKHVVVEKPMALTIEDADRMIEACDQNNVKLAVVHPNRFRPAMQELYSQLNRGAFGKISHVNATTRWNRSQNYYDQAPWRGSRAMDGGVLLNQGIHNIDLLLWMMGDVEEVFTYQANRLRDIESEDISVSVLRFQNGALGLVEAAVTIYRQNLEESLSIFGEKGTAIVSGPTANWIKKWEFEDMNIKATQQMMDNITTDPYGIPGHQCIIQDMTDAILHQRTPISSGVEGRQVLRIVMGCQLAAKTGKPVKI